MAQKAAEPLLPANLVYQAILIAPALPRPQGAEGRSAAGFAWIQTVVGGRPSAVAINWMSPSLRWACTITCASPLNTLRCQSGATGLSSMVSDTPLLTPPGPPMFFTITAMTLSPACTCGRISYDGDAFHSCDSAARV